MTTTKILYIAAVIVPFGFVLLAGAMLVHAVYMRRTKHAAVQTAASH